jgi:protein phosphatase
MSKAMVKSILMVAAGVSLLLMLILIIILILYAFKPWRFFSRSSRSRPIKGDDADRPLISEDSDVVQSQGIVFPGKFLEGTSHPAEGHSNSPRARGRLHKQRLQPTTQQLNHSDSFVLDIPDHPEDILLGQTLKRPPATNNSAEEHLSAKKEQESHEARIGVDNNDSLKKPDSDQRVAGSSLAMEVISGPARGLSYSIQSTNTSRLPLTLGRVPPSHILLKDTEVSGKHARIDWNPNKVKWELVDMGSLNGTMLNSHPINHADSGSRQWGPPTVLASGDVITLGTTSKILVEIKSKSEQIPFGVAVASDPMSMRRGGKKLPMEDVCFYQWPLSGAEQFGLFGICDGHGGASAAISASKIMPETIAGILSDSSRRERVLSQCDASDVLREAFYHTEECMNHYYEGCTATVLLVWVDGREKFFAQCANLGDSACILNLEGKQIKMTEDHRITSHTERQRIQATGEPLREGETRLCGLNLARMLGDKFLKQQESRFSSEPYISDAVCIDQAMGAFALLASDGFWDVVNMKKAVQLVLQMQEKHTVDKDNITEKIAIHLLNEARTQRTKDNTSLILLDFSSSNSCKHDS